MSEIKNDENMKMKIFREYFRYKIHPFWQKKLLKANQAKYKQVVNQVDYALIDLRNSVNNKIQKIKILIK